MAQQAILINGRPGAGKSTPAAGLAGELGCVALSKDSIKEALADAVPGLESALGAIAMDTVWALAAQVPDLVVIESWWFAPRDREFLARGLAIAGVQASVEVWCDPAGPRAAHRSPSARWCASTPPGRWTSPAWPRRSPGHSRT